MEQEIEQLKILVEDLCSKVESLEERVTELEEDKSSRPKGPEPILTCVQCLAEYKESENGEGYCKYHPGTLNYQKLSCCSKSVKNQEDLQRVLGCAKGKHHSKHHTKYIYAARYMYMRDLSAEAQEVWMEMDIYDYITSKCEWAEVGLSKDGNLFVVAGPSRMMFTTYAEFTLKDIKNCKKAPLVAFDEVDPSGWFLKCELLGSGSTANGITVTLKSSWSNVPYTKKMILILDGDSIKPGAIESLSDPRPVKPSMTYTVPEGTKAGPELEAGEDYSVGRKNDYPTESNDDMFGIELKQLGDTKVDSDTWRMTDGKWTNLFITDLKVINGALEIVSIVDVLGEYKDKDGSWIKCDKVTVGPKGKKEIFELSDFLIDGAAPMSLTVSLGIQFQDRPPNGNMECRRAHHLLPQPLLLRVTLVDKDKRTASLIFEQGNKPLPLATLEKRQASWAKKKPILFYMYADDVDLRERSDVALYYDDDGAIRYRPAPNNNGSTNFPLSTHLLETAAYKAKKSGEKEQELIGLRKENKGSKVEVFAVVDLDFQYSFALKVVITTPTSSAEGYYFLPTHDFSLATLTVEPSEVEVGSEYTVKWSMPFVCGRSDRIEIYKRYGKDDISFEHNRKELKDGSTQIKAPGIPGRYEARYYPKPLSGTTTGLGHDVYVAMDSFTVVNA